MVKTAWRLFLLLVLLAGCAAPGARSMPTPTPPIQRATPTLEISDALRRDAQAMAEDMDIPVAEALRRVKYQDDIGNLQAALTANEPETFAGLWIEHQPEYRIVVQFTRDGEQTIRPYLEGKPWADRVEVRAAEATLASLEAALAETMQVLQALDLNVIAALNVQENRVEVIVIDRAWFEAELDKAGVQLPEHVELVISEAYRGQEIDVCATPAVPGVAFPRQAPLVAVVMEAQLIGDLLLVDGCLRVKDIYSGGSILPIWPPEFTLGAENDQLQVLDGDGQVVARVGEEVYMGGGEVSSPSLPECVRQELPASCTGPYWIVGMGVRPNLRRDSELFALQVISTTQRSFFLLHKKPVLDEWAEADSPAAGLLVLYDGQRCPRVVSESGLTDYLPLWPPGYEVRVENDQIEILDGSGQAVARVGQAVRLGGGKIPVDWEVEEYRRLYYELPGDCHGPYWIVGD